MNPGIVFESPTVRDRKRIVGFLREGRSVLVIEPFHAYHHRGNIRFFPNPLPEYVEKMVDNGMLRLIRATEIDARSLYAEAADRAVDAVETVYPVYRKDVERIIRLVSGEIGDDVELAFQKNLCDRLGGFFSMNLLMHRLSRLFGSETVEFVPGADVDEYGFYRDLVEKSCYPFLDFKNIKIPGFALKRYRWKNRFHRATLIAKVFMQATGALFTPSRKKNNKSPERKSFKYGIGIIAPRRQFRGNQRGVDFLVDNEKIYSHEVVYIPLVDLDLEQKKSLESLGSGVAYLPRLGRFFSHWQVWAKLGLLGLQTRVVPNCDLIELAAISLFTAHRWKALLSGIKINHFITHSDFANSHVSRNILLNQDGTTTWYYTDASNFGHSFRENQNMWNRHPFWAYQIYDHLLTWNEDLAEFFSRHPHSYRKTNVIGSLWSSHVDSSCDRKSFLSQFFDARIVEGKFVVVAFASTYTVSGITSYEEGIEFARHLERIVLEFDDLLVLLKEKKDQQLHIRLDPKRGPELLNVYETMNAHPRIHVASKLMDASEAMGNCDLCISFPYTSTTNEAIGFQIPAIWHDPNEYYRQTPYAKHGKLVTHGYNELKQRVLEMKRSNSGVYKPQILEDSPLFDPHRDGKAIERFRDLLCRHYDE